MFAGKLRYFIQMPSRFHFNAVLGYPFSPDFESSPKTALSTSVGKLKTALVLFTRFAAALIREVWFVECPPSAKILVVLRLFIYVVVGHIVPVLAGRDYFFLRIRIEEVF